MTKDDLLEHFDEIVTDPRLRPSGSSSGAQPSSPTRAERADSTPRCVRWVRPVPAKRC
jgi:hypothetical protein